MGGGVVAYGTARAAEDAAARHGGQVIGSLALLLARGSGEQR